MTGGPGGRPFVGIQVSPIALVDEGIERVLDIVAEKGHVNTLLLASHGFDYANVGRASEAYPDHGVHERYNLTGGSYFTPHPEFYAGTILPPFRAPDPDLAGVDIIAATLEPARQRGIQVHPWIYENPYGPLPAAVPNWTKVSEIDCYGRVHHNPCLNNPDYRAWWMSIVEDIVKSYGVPGLMWGSERVSPLWATFVGALGHRTAPTCFCRHCAERAVASGLDPRRAREGYRALWELVEAAGRDGYRPPPDGQFVAVWRLLVEYPEMLGWERLWRDTRRDFRGALYGTAKAISPTIQVGWHIWQMNSFNPFFRALHDYGDIAHYADFVKPVVYDNPAGARFKRHVEALEQRFFRGAAPQTIAEFFYGQLGLDEGALDSLPERGWSAEYVYRETRRVVEGVAGACKVYPGIGINIPSGPGNKQSSPDDVRAAIAAADRAGADGVVLSRQYSEMFFSNLEAAGEALRAWSGRGRAAS